MEINKKIQFMPYLSKTAIATALDKNPNTLRNSLAYWKSTGLLRQVKRGYFVFQSYLDKSDNALYYPRFIATKMIEPSYLSKEFVLQDYGMFTDAVFGYSVVTTKKTQTIKNEFGEYNYQSIKPELFIGFVKKTQGAISWNVATKAKALFDYLYFNKHKFQRVNIEELEILRLNLTVMQKKDWTEFASYVKTADKKMLAIYSLIKNYVN